eukprot:3919403-Prymnesium_polylepis.1
MRAALYSGLLEVSAQTPAPTAPPMTQRSMLTQQPVPWLQHELRHTLTERSLPAQGLDNECCIIRSLVPAQHALVPVWGPVY